MSQPTASDRTGTDPVAAALRAARTERPRVEARQRTLAALGLPVGPPPDGAGPAPQGPPAPTVTTSLPPAGLPPAGLPPAGSTASPTGTSPVPLGPAVPSPVNPPPTAGPLGAGPPAPPPAPPVEALAGLGGLASKGLLFKVAGGTIATLATAAALHVGVGARPASLSTAPGGTPPVASTVAAIASARPQPHEGPTVTQSERSAPPLSASPLGSGAHASPVPLTDEKTPRAVDPQAARRIDDTGTKGSYDTTTQPSHGAGRVDAPRGPTLAVTAFPEAETPPAPAPAPALAPAPATEGAGEKSAVGAAEGAPPGGVAPPGSPAQAGSAAPAASTIGEEIAQLEQVRAALRRRAGGEARAALTAYRARFPRGVMASEAFMLDIETLALTDPAAARARAEGFLAANPRSPLAPRVRALLGNKAEGSR